MIEKFYTVDQVADMIDMHPKTIRKFIREGKLKANKVGKQWRITGHDLSVFTEGTGPEGIIDETRDITFSTEDKGQTSTHGVTVSTVVDMDVKDMEEGTRIANMLMAVMNNKDTKYGTSTMNVQFIEKEKKTRIMLWGTLSFMEAMLGALDVLTQQ
ncbi:helix-turn-helix domain-containing protein [Vallitalea pronyensis]|uniref:Helix-turn-helix domain-containing protein n=1 Tax=Vallitalea pronyensis TaxID=1348613 RepID=A0A8J8SGJ2_9FIRM|nr:helix-turn-helix domain-containing protein [Vallitalea pronyensis]QUI22378.1 helix-turn-helix domain-containing protein [Vallitalea pronyensis]